MNFEIKNDWSFRKYFNPLQFRNAPPFRQQQMIHKYQITLRNDRKMLGRNFLIFNRYVNYYKLLEFNIFDKILAKTN